jgi:hypothetical protein
MSETPHGGWVNEAELDDLAAALRGLAPRASGLDRAALMFRAGRASAPRRWAWPLATAASTLVAAVLGGVLLMRPAPPPREHTVHIVVVRPEPPAPEEPAPGPAVSAEPPPPVDAVSPGAVTRYRRMQEHLLHWGFDGLPTPPPSPAQKPATVDSLLQSL